MKRILLGVWVLLAGFTAQGQYSNFTLMNPTLIGRTDVKLWGEAANTLALRNGAAAQTLNIYNTYTSGSNYEAASLGFSGGVFNIASYHVGGTAKNIDFYRGGVQRISIKGGDITFYDDLLFSGDNLYDIGASGATRPRSIYLGGGGTGSSVPGLNISQVWNNGATTFNAALVNVTDTASASASLLMDLQVGGVSQFKVDKVGAVTTVGAIVVGGNLTVPTAGVIRFGAANRTRIESPGDGDLLFRDSGSATFGKLQFGGTTASFPSIKRNAAAINFRLADDSADAAITAGAITGSGQALFGTASNSGITASGNLRLGNNGYIIPQSDGVWTLTDSSTTLFYRLIFGTNDTNGFSIKKNGTTSLQFRNGGDTADAAITSGSITSTGISTLNGFQYGSIITVTYGATTDIAFNGANLRSVTLTGDVTFTTSGKGGGRHVNYRVVGDASVRNLIFPAGWKWTTAIPATLAANKNGYLSLICWGAAETDIQAKWEVEP